jgi:hypothetical protein
MTASVFKDVLDALFALISLLDLMDLLHNIPETCKVRRMRLEYSDM